ncbi:MAG: glycosyltransferase, partial [Verrucomicrobiota bacterium]|nr:glycosyltransferase [Verrucomicrobiota bacterium]
FTRMPKVSIIIPTDSPVRAQHCMEHLLATTDYPEFEIIIVTNSKLAEVLNAAKPAGAPVHCVVYDEPFNFSAKCNAGANAATGDRLIFFNDDVEASQRGWIQELIEPLENPEIGAVAPKLLYETGKIQHAGLVTGVRGLVGTAFHEWAGDSTDYTNMAQSLRDVSALSGACLAMRRKDFVELGEWDAVNAPIAHSDLDLCFKVREAGLRCVYTPFVTLTHRGHESIGWEKPEDEPRAPDNASVFLLKRWAGYTARDPFFTDRMREWLYADSPTPIDMWGRNELKVRESRANLLFVSHDLTWSGAPLILLEMAKWCRARGFFVTLMSPEDGPLRERIVATGIPLIVDPLVTKSHPSFPELARQFDCVIASTIFGAPVVNSAKAAGIPHLWWIHEGRVAESYFDKHAAIRTAIALADFVVTPDTRSAQVYQPFRDEPIRVLPYGIDDPRGADVDAEPRTSGPLSFLLLGSIEHRKGTEIFLEVVRLLAREISEQARFDIVGRPHDPALTEKVRSAADEIPNLTYHGGVSPEEALAFVRAADVVVCASWDETGPLMLIEALAFGKPIVSTKVGAVSEHVKDEGVGVFVEPGNARELAAAIGRMVQEREQLAAIGARAREAYERFFTFQRFGEGFEALLEEVISTTRGATQLPTLDRAAR